MAKRWWTPALSGPKRAFLRRADLVTTYSVWALLEEGAEQRNPSFTNSSLAEALGLAKKTVLRHLKILQRMGLVHPVQVKSSAGFDVIFIRRLLRKEHKRLLRRLYAGEL